MSAKLLLPQGFKGSNAKRLAVEVPVADTGPQATAQLAADLLGGLPAELAQSFTLVFADVEAALSALHSVPNSEMLWACSCGCGHAPAAEL